MDIITITPEMEEMFRPVLPYISDDPNILTVGAIEGETALGAITGEYYDDYLEITFLLVLQEHRRKGIATAMVRYLCDIALEEEYPVKCTFEAENEDDEVHKFFSKLDGFSVTQNEGVSCIVPYEQIKNGYLSKLNLTPSGVVPFFSLNNTDRDSFYNRLLAQGILYLEDKSDDDFVHPLCLCKMSNGMVVACIFIEPEGENGLKLSLAYREPRSNKQLIEVFTECRRIALDMYGEDMVLYIEAVTGASEELLTKLFPERVVTGHFYTASMILETEWQNEEE